MTAIRLSVRRAGALAAFVVATLLAGCTTYPDSYYASDDRYGGDYYYGRADRYYDDPYWGAYAYDSIFWPTYRWYDPWYSPAYSYGVSFSPSWFGLSFGYFGGRRYPWGYHHYAPYRASWWDNRAYYGGAGWRHGYRDGLSGRRFGSARNEAERIARAEGVARPQRDDTAGLRSYAPESYRGGGYSSRGSRSRGIDYGDRGAPRSADEATQLQRDAAWRGDAQRDYSRYRSDEAPIRRSYDWRESPRDDRAPREIDSRALGGYDSPRRYDRDARRIDHSSDAYSRARDVAPRYDTPAPRYEQRYEQPRYQQPRHEGGGMSRPAGPSRSYAAPSMPSTPAPRADSGGHSRGESHRSREPD
ncbi:MAG TPA: hypothetical protein VND91_09175 [Candidatus Saccharimonadia bacterium]|nr:hypothetical protein [Candidatus Saccharimonadia bacterium]